MGSTPLPEGTFRDTVVVVTGGGTGLGKAIATEFGRLGATVAILSRAAEHRDAGCAAVTDAGGTAAGFEVDIRDAEAVGAVVADVTDQLGLPTVLVNNAAGNFPVPAEDLSPNGWRAVTQIVLDGTFFCSRAVGRQLIAAAQPGSIVNIGASYAWTGGPGFAHSAAAKAGVKSLTESLAVEWGPYGIRVNGLVPGLFPHEDEAEHIRATPGRGVAEDRRAPALRAGQPRELGWAAVFLCSPWASYITGHTLVVDGANWQRRAMLQPEVTPIREQLGKGPFEL
jgi:NAD(P)-dependent dehydrogenase (short-subunit alcohol dehydrogenase family)